LKIVVELGTLNVFHDQVELSWCVDYVVEPHDVSML